MAVRVVLRSIVTGFRGWPRATVSQGLGTSSWFGLRTCSSTATRQLLAAVETELKLETKAMDRLPAMDGFETTINGSMATLTRTSGDNLVKVELDANHSIEVTPEELLGSEGEDEDTEDDVEPMFVPAFTVTVTKPSGDSVEMECSFEEYGPYLEHGKAWECLRIDSASVLPVGTEDPHIVYTADTRNLSQALYEQLSIYLKEQGIDEQFSDNMIDFYRSFEHNCYCNSFLKQLQKFLSQK